MPKPTKSYPASLVGERHYQTAIGDAAIGDVVHLLAEHGNPYDDRALVATDAAGRTLGYIHRDSWLRGALIDEGQGCAATISDLAESDAGFVMVEVSVTLSADAPIGAREFVPAD